MNKCKNSKKEKAIIGIIIGIIIVDFGTMGLIVVSLFQTVPIIVELDSTPIGLLYKVIIAIAVITFLSVQAFSFIYSIMDWDMKRKNGKN